MQLGENVKNKVENFGVEVKRLLALVGPTASGKSDLAVKIAQTFGGEIVNCDSMQMHRLLDIGTAKPSAELRGKVPHHLYDIIDPADFFSAGKYMLEARKICKEVCSRGRVPIVTGGTGLYLKVLLEGIFEGPGREMEIRDRLEKIAQRKGLKYLHNLLRKRDPKAFHRIQSTDRIRVFRALEIYLKTGNRISDLQDMKEPLEGFTILKIGLELSRSRLYDRIDRRVFKMFHDGLVEETESLLNQGYNADSKCFEALGYCHVISSILGKISKEVAVEMTQRDTRRYAKRQMTWFRKDPQIHWIKGPGEEEFALERALGIIGNFWD